MRVSQQKIHRDYTSVIACFAKQHDIGQAKLYPFFVPQENVFVIPKRFKSQWQVFMQESWYHSGLISKDKDRKNLPVSPFLPGANLRVDNWLPRENV